MPQTYLEDVQREGQTVNPLFVFLGVEVLELGPDRATLQLKIKPELIQGAGMAAGGILATLLDETMAHAVLAGNNPGQHTTTVDMNTSYYRPANKHATLVCEARVSKRGKRMVFAEAVIRHNGHETARATATFLIL